MINYFEEYHFSRDVQTQKMFIKQKLRTNQNLLTGYKKQIATNTVKLRALMTEGRIDEAEKIQKILMKDRKKVIALQYENAQIEAIYPISEDSIELPLKEDQIGNLYFSLKIKIITESLEKDWDNLRQMAISKQPISEERILKIKKLKEKVTQLLKMRHILCNAQRRREYISRIERQEYDEILEENKNGRIVQERKYIKSILGNEFNPDMSLYKDKEIPCRWRVKLYDTPERLFIGRSNYPNQPQINQSIQAYRYGIFEYEYMLNKSGESTYSDSLCEVIGVTKKAIDGTETTNFLIVPLRYFSGLKDVTLDQGGRIIKSSETKPIHRMRSKTHRNKGIVERLFSNLPGERKEIREKRNKNQKGNKGKYKRTLDVKVQKYQLKDQERDFFANVYLSDYLIENAIKNNAHYLGTYIFEGDTRSVVYDTPIEHSRVAACSSAKKNKGTLIKRMSSGLNKSQISSLDELFEVLSIAQNYLVYENSKRLKKTNIRED